MCKNTSRVSRLTKGTRPRDEVLRGALEFSGVLARHCECWLRSK